MLDLRESVSHILAHRECKVYMGRGSSVLSVQSVVHEHAISMQGDSVTLKRKLSVFLENSAQETLVYHGLSF